MEPTATPDIWIVLWPVIIGGLVAILPTIVGQIVGHLFAQSSAKATRSREQYMKLAEGIASYEDWINRRHNSRAFGELDPGASPLPSVIAIASLDFPVLLDALDAVTSAARDYELWQNHAGLKRLAGNIAEVNEGLDGVYGPFAAAISGLKYDLRVVGVSLHED